jgi:hypothetical protein
MSTARVSRDRVVVILLELKITLETKRNRQPRPKGKKLAGRLVCLHRAVCQVLRNGLTGM